VNRLYRYLPNSSSLVSRLCWVVTFALFVMYLIERPVSGQQLTPFHPPAAPDKTGSDPPSASEFRPFVPAKDAGKSMVLSPLRTSAETPPLSDNRDDTPLKPLSPSQIPLSADAPIAGLETGGDPDSDYVQAVFLLPGPPASSRQPPEIPDELRLSESWPPEKNDSLLAVERDLNKALREGEPGFLDALRMEDFYQTAVSPYRIYRGSEATLSYLPRSNRNLGWASLEWEPYLKRNQLRGLTGSMQHHFLTGPRTIDLPPRLHDFILGYQHRGQIRERFSFDCAASVGIFSDFRGSVREGFRFPAHAVGIIHASHRADLVFGVDYLDRDDYPLLPVMGISWHDLNFTALRYDLVFPRPRIDFTANDGERYYLAGRLGGGTWDMEYPSGVGDVMTYRDFRLLFGKEKRYLDGSRHGIELGYVFGRKLAMRETLEEANFSNAFILRLISSY
jgi:hypothetical protein